MPFDQNENFSYDNEPIYDNDPLDDWGNDDLDKPQTYYDNENKFTEEEEDPWV